MRASLLVSAMTLTALGCFGPWSFGDHESSGSGQADPAPDMPPPTPQTTNPPDFGATKHQTVAPPPISGGTLAVTPKGNLAVVADPDRDTVTIVDLGAHAILGAIALTAGDEPGRVVIDGSNRAHVVLRRGGALVTIDLATRAVLARRPVCASPRGVAHDPVGDVVHVACAGGDLVTFPAAGGDATIRATLETDLRDVIVQKGGGLLVSRFRSAEVLTVAREDRAGPNGTTTPTWAVTGRSAPTSMSSSLAAPTFAWRIMPPRPGGDGAVVVHQRASGLIDDAIDQTTQSEPPSPYGSGVEVQDGPVTTFVTDLTQDNASMKIPNAVLPVDIASSADGTRYAIVAAGNGHTSALDALITMGSSDVQSGFFFGDTPAHHVTGQLTSVAFVDSSHVVVFMREPATLFVVPLDDANETLQRIDLGGESREDTGHAVFHSDTGHGIACASCHAEGGDDGQTWTFTKEGVRRTPSLRGTLEGTAPYHWAGELADVPSLVHQVYVSGMGGQSLEPDQNDALRGWLFAVPRPPVEPASDAAAVARGKTLFEGQAQCATCHTGPRLTSNATVDVGTGGRFQVPSLVGVSMRTPLLHDGCAKTLTDRFTTCGSTGDQHGKTSALAPADVSDLVAYLSTL